MFNGKKIGFIGSGNMASALVSGLLKGKHVQADQIVASDRDPNKTQRFAERFHVSVTQDNASVVENSDIIVIAVKPQVIDKVMLEIGKTFTKEKLLISIAAGVKTSHLEKQLPSGGHVIRVMPNIAAMVDAAASALSVGAQATQDDLTLALGIFNAVGKCVVVDEEQLDAVTGLSGSGPAYIFLMIDSMADAGVKVGLNRENALLLASQTVFGAAKYLMESGEHPGRLKDMVTSPGGTAIAGIHTLEQGGLRTTLINAVEAATKRSQELGEK